MNALASAARCAIAAGLIFVSHPAAALYAEIKPTLRVGLNCIGEVSQLAPKLTACTIAGAKIRIWCPNGRMFEGAIEQGGPPASIARSLCEMAQVP